MFELKVACLYEANLLVAESWPTRIVSLTGDVDVQHNTPIPHLHVQVNDVGHAAHWALRPTPEHLQTVLQFTEDLTDEDRLLVHCFAGQSRSTAIAIGILLQHGMDHQQAFEHVASIRDILLPNTLFIQHIDDYFGLHNKLVEHVANHHR